MKRILTMSLLLAGLTCYARAEERRPDVEEYRAIEATEPVVSQAPAQVQSMVGMVEDRTAPPQLTELRQTHLQALNELRIAILAAGGPEESLKLERQAEALKLKQQREELQWLKANAHNRQDLDYATQLEAAIRDLEPAPTPVAGAWVPRDPVSGQALTTGEGGAQ